MTATPDPTDLNPFRSSWLRTGRLAIGALPRSREAWLGLARQGVRSVFSCCDPQEAPWQPLPDWPRVQVPLPDHRDRQAMDAASLDHAISAALALYRSTPALYLHCLAGIERSPLVAVGVLCRAESLHLLDALAQVRALHPPARPLISQLLVLEALLGP